MMSRLLTLCFGIVTTLFFRQDLFDPDVTLKVTLNSSYDYIIGRSFNYTYIHGNMSL